MMTVKVPVPVDDLDTPMRNMMQWLVDMRFSTSSFTRREIAGRFVVRVKFTVAEEAVAFADHFNGSVLP